MQQHCGTHTRPSVWEWLRATAHGDGENRTFSLALTTIQAKRTTTTYGFNLQSQKKPHIFAYTYLRICVIALKGRAYTYLRHCDLLT
eukprot:1947472-Pleurochrysis_carterae.AAC.1